MGLSVCGDKDIDPWHIGAWTKLWPPFWRWQFQMHFLQQKYLNFKQNFTGVSNKSTLVQVKAWHQQMLSYYYYLNQCWPRCLKPLSYYYYLNQCWPRCLKPYGVTRPECVYCCVSSDFTEVINLIAVWYIVSWSILSCSGVCHWTLRVCPCFSSSGYSRNAYGGGYDEEDQSGDRQHQSRTFKILQSLMANEGQCPHWPHMINWD